MQFEINQKVVCLKSDWINGNDIKEFRVPKAFDILTVQNIKIHDNVVLLSFYEYHFRVFYPSKFFRAVDYEFAEAILKNISKKETEV